MKDVNFLKNSGVNVDSSLELFGDMDTYNETLQDFLNTVDEKLSNIQKYKESSDMKNYAIFIHSLKSDARYLGFTYLAELALNHEMESKANNSLYVYDNYDNLISETNRVINVVREYLGKTPIVISTANVSKSDKKILVVDDSDIIRNLIKKMFDDEFVILTANDGEEALEIVRTNSELFGVLLDLNMPNVNGFAVLEYFKENGLFSKIPVAIITGDDTKETIERAFTYTIVDVLTKPFNEANVRRVINSMETFK
ncbi:MAG: response regulator [Clostridium sp.]|nr:response regulator [Clostridium sp.]MCM1444318.1 response regulator [Candidatus Amulumruptor caecigallinarius]